MTDRFELKLQTAQGLGWTCRLFCFAYIMCVFFFSSPLRQCLQNGEIWRKIIFSVLPACRMLYEALSSKLMWNSMTLILSLWYLFYPLVRHSPTTASQSDFPQSFWRVSVIVDSTKVPTPDWLIKSLGDGPRQKSIVEALLLVLMSCQGIKTTARELLS